MRYRTIVIGGGITGLAATERLVERLGGDAVLLVERDTRLGGKIRTDRRNGFVLEGGPDCFLAMKPGGVALCRHLGIADRLVGTNPALRRSFVKRGRRLHPLPDGITGLVPSRIAPLVTTPLLSLGGRLRAGLEVLVPRRRNPAPESVAGFARRRFGREAWDYLMEPLLSGIYAGDGDQLSLDATFPQLPAMEAAHGSLLRPMLLASLAKRPSNGTSPAGFVTLPGGLGEIVEALVNRLPGQAIRTGAGVHRLYRRTDGTYRAELSDGHAVEAETVLLATPANVAAGIMASLDTSLAAALDEIPFASVATVSLAFPRAAVPRPLDGYGYVCPRAQGGEIVACTWTSNKFPGRVPADAVLVRAFVGRAGHDGIVYASDEVIVRQVREELAAIHGIATAPALTSVVRWPKGMPQYTMGHEARLARIAQRLEYWPGLHLAGSSYRGVGIPDCISAGWAAADEIAASVPVASVPVA